ncbi:MAG: hypothetical protein KKC84_06655, partial [Candidatus Omnitrophica bacterium]|nr:hypothetical protein [Candidatus Omnitrophota bacterium]
MMPYKVAVIHPFLTTSGGSEAVALHMVEALQDDYAVTLVSTGGIDLCTLNDAYGTSVCAEKIKICVLPLWKNATVGSALRSAIFQRYCQNLAKRFDLMISAYNPMSFPRKGMQYVCDFSFDKKLAKTFYREKTDSGNDKEKEGFCNNLYHLICRMATGAIRQSWRENQTLTDSYWCTSVLQDHFGVSSKVIYPPVAEHA